MTKYVLRDNGVSYKHYRIEGMPFVEGSEEGKIFFGDNLSMNNGMMGNQIVTVGNNVKLGGGVKEYTTDFHNLNYTRRRDYEEDMNGRKYAPVMIDDDCFIGAGVIILKRIHIDALIVIVVGGKVLHTLC